MLLRDGRRRGGEWDGVGESERQGRKQGKGGREGDGTPQGWFTTPCSKSRKIP